MEEYAPKAIRAVYDAVRQRIPPATLAGIRGDSSHTYGYHRARAWIMRQGLGTRDYSVQQADDRKGPDWAASALDIGLPRSTMIAVTRRLITATTKRDPRLLPVREFFGTLNGRDVTGRDVRSRRTITSDDSHLTHVHLSIYRRWADDTDALAPIADVITGQETYMTIRPEDLTAIAKAVNYYDSVPAVPPPDANDDWPTNDTWQLRYGISTTAKSARAAERLAGSADAKADQALAELAGIRAMLEQLIGQQ